MKKSNRKSQRNNRQRQLLHVRASDRRGVLLLVVLSILILFLLIGTTFILTAGQHKDRAKILEKANRTTFQPEDVLERALMQLVRDTNNRHSALRYHSLLRDVYGGDGFVGQVLADLNSDPDLLPRFAGVSSTDNDPYGVTTGQLVDIFVVDDDSMGNFSPRNAVGLDLDSQGIPIDYSLSVNDAYYNGCLLTLMEGPCRGTSVRIIDYDFDTNSRVARLRVMAPSRHDGQALTINNGSDENTHRNALTDFYNHEGVGYRFIVNGRPHNGTGVGFNAFTDHDDAKLTALEAILDPSGSYYGIELALSPNSTYFNQNGLQHLLAQVGSNPFQGALTDLDFGDLRDGNGNSLYPNFPGPGDSDESYDAPDFQNMFLAQQSLTPRFRGRLRNPDSNRLFDPASYDSQNAPDLINLKNITIPSLHRPALVNFWFHRLFYSDWLSGLSETERYLAILDPYNSSASPDQADQIAAIKRRYSMRPTRDDHPNFDGSNVHSLNELARGFANPVNLNNGLITAPTWEIIGPWDVDNDGDGVPDSVWVDLGLPVQKTEDGRFYKPLVAMLVEDLDNRLNVNAHGSLDHFANAELDLSSIVRDRNGSPISPVQIKRNLAQDLNSNAVALFSSDQLPTGMGYGPADISLRSILSPRLARTPAEGNPQYDDYARLLIGRPSPEDANRNVADAMNLTVDFGRYGSRSAQDNMGMPAATAGKTFDTTDPISMGMTREARVPYDFPGYPNFAGELYNSTVARTPSGYGEVPDLIGRYATAISAVGKPLYEAKSDFQTNPNLTLLDDSPYEIDLSSGGRRGVPSEWELVASSGLVSEDAPYSPAELERILRAGDADVGELPSRLWDVVDSFDPEKSVFERSISSGNIADPDNYANARPNSLQRVIAQATTSITRRQVTTDSYSLPVPNENWTSRLLLGADGIAGSPNFDDDGDGTTDEGDEVGTNLNGDSDDYIVVMLPYFIQNGLYSAAAEVPLPTNARLTDYLEYRVVLEFAKAGDIPTIDQVNNVIHGDDRLDVSNARSGPYTQGGMLAPEVLAGRKMDLNRPFGDGRDNNNNGTVDEPEEAGEPWIDSNANGVWDMGEPFLNLDGSWDDRNNNGILDADEDPTFTPSQDYTWVDLNGNGLEDSGEQAPFDYTGGKDASNRGVALTAGGPRVIRDKAQLARQLYARHLYCLMLAVMDENYLAPYDVNDPQVLHYLDARSRGSVAYQIREFLENNPPPGYPWPGYSGNTTADARRMAMRKLTCRQVAQWAINCVDMRDPDSVQTPFEYDENPWDGWNVTANGNFYPIDGDVATDENYGMFRDLSGGDFNTVASADANAVPAGLRTRGIVWGAERPEALLTEGLAWHDRRVQDLALGSVSGASEDDEDSDDDNGQVSDDVQQIEDGEADNDLDQRLKPAGRTYVEIHNPWTDGANLAAELYRDPFNSTIHLDSQTTFRRYDSNSSGTIEYASNSDDLFAEGILLDRLSDGIAIDGLPSPVWRMACTETHPLIRNASVPDQFTVEVNDDPYSRRRGGIGNNGKYFDLTIENGPWAYESNVTKQVGEGAGAGSTANIQQMPRAYLSYFNRLSRETQKIMSRGTTIDTNADPANSFAELSPRNTDPDFPSFDRLAQPIYRARSNVKISNPGLGNTGSVDRRIMLKPNDYLERLFYFSGAPSVEYQSRIGDVRDLINGKGVHVPNLFYDVELDGTVITSLRKAGQGELLDGTADPISLEDDGLQIAALQPAFGEPRAVLRVHISRFPALDYFDADGDHPSDKHEDANPLESVPLAPLLPGRYAVVGTAGEVFGKSTTDYDTNTTRTYDNLEDRYTSIISRSKSSADPARDPADLEFLDPPDGINNEQVSFRRIEMIPSTNPNRTQFIVRMNGGIRDFSSTDYPRTSEVVDLTPTISGDNGEGSNLAAPHSSVPTMVNVTDPVQYDGGTPVIQPIVAIPMEGFTISEPMDGYLLRQLELDPQMNQIYYKDPRFPNTSDRPAQGAYVNSSRDPAGYDEPFDLLPELIENQTTPNYRTMHLQRLANPRLAWNPPPVSGAGQVDLQHDSTRPVNPYLTIDSISLDLTSLNSTSSREAILSNTPTVSGVTGPEVRHQVSRNQLPSDTTGNKGTGRPYTKVTLQSQERGLHGQAPTTGEPLPSRTLWNQDRATGTTELILDQGVALAPNDKIHSEAAGLNAKSRYSFGTDESLAGSSYKESVFDYPLRHSLGFANRAFGKFFNFQTDVQAGEAQAIDVDGDGDPGEYDLVGGLEVTSTGSDTVVTPVFHWPNRPFISEGEIIQVPIWSSSRMLTYYSVYNAALDADNQPNQYDMESPGDDNSKRWYQMHTTFGHLPNFFATSASPSRISTDGNNVRAVGAPHFYRILDYLHVPSRFMGTDTLLAPEQFAAVSAEVDDPRRELAAPFNRVDNYREPGKVNLNTVVGQNDGFGGGATNSEGILSGESKDRWSEVYDGIMHRHQDENLIDYANGTLIQMGHLGPAWRDIEQSRRGYTNVNSGVNYNPLYLNPNFPTFFANPFRAEGESLNVPLFEMRQEEVVAGRLRPHHWSPGQSRRNIYPAWGNRDNDGSIVDKDGDQNADNNGIRNDSNEAGTWDDQLLRRNSVPQAVPNATANEQDNLVRVPLMSGAALEPSIDTERNSHLRYQPITRLSNLTTTRSGVFAVWMTVGFFEVTPASNDSDIAARYFNDGIPANGFINAEREDLFFRIYPDGYTLGREIGLDTGENRRHRGFYIVDRTRPVAFKPGEDLNVDDAVLLRRRIE